MERLSTNGIQDGNRMNHTVQTNHDVRFNFETYIFDLDGTLLSTLEDLAASCNYALRTHLSYLRLCATSKGTNIRGERRLNRLAEP